MGEPQAGLPVDLHHAAGPTAPGRPLAEWLLEECRRLGLRGATLIAAAQGQGRHRKIHSAHFIELADQPVEVTMAVDAGECERVFALLRQEGIGMFYIKAPIEFGLTASENA